jgi:hypothetical protein
MQSVSYQGRYDFPPCFRGSPNSRSAGAGVRTENTLLCFLTSLVRGALFSIHGMLWSSDYHCAYLEFRGRGSEGSKAQMSTFLRNLLCFS